MILQALVKYHDRLVAEGRMPPSGYVRQDIPFLVILNREGRFRGLDDTRAGEGRAQRARQFLVPKPVSRPGPVIPFLLWDNPAYVFGRSKPDNTKDPKKQRERATEQHRSFVEFHTTIFPTGDCPPGVQAVQRFLNGNELELAFNDPLWPTVEKEGRPVSFMIEGETQLVCEDQAVVNLVGAMAPRGDAAGDTAQCLVTGDLERIALRHTEIKGVYDPNAQVPRKLIGFKPPAFCSHQKKQGMNAPVGVVAEAAYTAALNTLLSRDSRQKMTVGGTTTVFWAERQTPMEDVLADLFGFAPEVTDSPRDLDGIRALLTAPKTGVTPPLNDPTPFYVLGLAPNAARIAVRFWHVGTVAGMAGHIVQYFEDMLVVRPPNVPECPRLGELLRSTAVEGKPENIAPKLAGEMVAAIISGQPFPRPLLATVIRRIKAEQGKKNSANGKPVSNVSPTRAALIKALLVRQTPRNQSDRKEVDVSLDVTNTNAGYRLGRLFAVLERIQERAMPGIKATIRDRYYGSASTTPVLSFPILCKLHTHHLSKLENRGEAVNLGKLVGEIVDGLSAFPAHLNLDDQGRFAIGYYHQRQAFFKKSTDTPHGDEQ